MEVIFEIGQNISSILSIGYNKTKHATMATPMIFNSIQYTNFYIVRSKYEWYI